MSKAITFDSRKSQETLLRDIEAGLREREANPLFNLLTGRRFGNKVVVKTRRGILLWPGRGLFVGSVSHAEHGSRLTGRLSGVWIAPVIPVVVWAPALAFLPEQLYEILVMWGVCIVFGIAIVRYDRTKILDALRDVTGN